MGGEETLDGTHKTASELLLIGAPLQQALLGRIGQAAELDERRGDVLSGQHGEIGEALRAVAQRYLAPELDHDLVGEQDGQIAGLAPCQVQQDISDISRLMRQTNTADKVRPVLAERERG